MSALSIWGVFTEDSIAQATKALSPDGRMYSVDRMVSKLSPKVMLINAWQGRMEINDLVVKVATMCKASQVDMLMIENKASGISVSQEMRRLYSNENFSVQLHDPKSIDKMSRLYAVQHLFAEGLIYAPNRSWADMVINECAIFPKGKHDDIVDTVSQALNYLRQTGILQRPEEIQNDIEADLRHTSMKAAPLYNA
jgi:predicted phage terminase large subunit-like protein